MQKEKQTIEDETAGSVQEVVGTFFEADHIKAAISELIASGFDRTEIGLLGGERSIERSLGQFYARAARLEQTSDAPAVAFVTQKDEDDTFHGLLGGLFFGGATTMAGALVVSAAALGGAALAAAGGVAAVGAVGAVAALAIRQPEADRLKEQLDEGHLLLFVRTPTAERAKLAVDILAKHCAHDPTVLEVDGTTEAG